MRVSPARAAVVGGLLVAAVFGFLIQPFLAIFGITAAVLVLAWSVELDTLDREDWPVESAEPRAIFLAREPVHLSDELIELLKSAMEIADRGLAAGRLVPFLVYEDPKSGRPRTRTLPHAGAGDALASARRHARGSHPDIVRLVLAGLGDVELEGRPQRAVIYEAADRQAGSATLTFAQRYKARRLIFPAATVGRPIFVGRADYRLRPS
jgi:hypothetical protein